MKIFKKKIIKDHYRKMQKDRMKKNPPSKEHFQEMQKKSVEARKKKKEEGVDN